MALHYEDLVDEVRSHMLDELALDGPNVYLSNRLTPFGWSNWHELLQRAFSTVSDATLEQEILDRALLLELETSHRNGIRYSKRVPANAAQVLAEGEFNRFYLRGLCLVSQTNAQAVEVYRAREVRNPRPESTALIGMLLDPTELLQDLRSSTHTDAVLCLPPGPASGLSGRLADPH